MKKTLFAILFTACFITNVKAADYMWPVGGENANETYIEYGYETRHYDTTVYDKTYDYEPKELNYGSLSKCAGKTTCTENHYGLDITGIKGNTYNIASVSSGKVIATSANRFFYSGINFPDRNQRRASKDGGGYGNYVVIQEESTGLCFLYAHMKAGTISVKAGDRVIAGQIIGVMGSSGDAGHMHIHFEVRPNLNAMTTNYGGSLTVTTGFNKETLDPRNYIGDTAPVIIEPTEPVEEQPEEIVEQSTLTAITSENNKIYVTFDNEITVVESPTLKVKIGDYTRDAKYVGITIDNKSLVYSINYTEFDVMAYGKINVSSSGGKVINKNSKVEANTNGENTIGELTPYTIDNIYGEIINKQAGDIDRNGTVDAGDAAIVLELASKVGADGYSSLTVQEKEQYSRSDINKDGKVSSDDAIEILVFSAQKGAGVEFKKIIKCDVNNDGIINQNDYHLLNDALINKKNTYDIDGNNVLNEQDLEDFKNILQKYGSR